MSSRVPARTLEGTVVIEFGDDLAGSICSYHLALLGATVYIVEPEQGCWLRHATVKNAATRAAAPLFAQYGLGKKSVLQSHAFSVSDERLHEIDLIIEPRRRSPAYEQWITRSRAGQYDGPVLLSFREAAGSRLTELTAQAASGMSAFLGVQEAAPYRIGFEIVTNSAAVMAVQALLAALPYKKNHGLGQRVEVPFSRVAANILNNVTTGSVATEQDTFFSRGWKRPPSPAVPCADGHVEFLFYGPGSEKQWRSFCEEIGLSDLARDERLWTYTGRQDNLNEMINALAPTFAKYSRDDLLKVLHKNGAMAVPRYTVNDAARSQQTRENTLVSDIQDRPGAVLVEGPWVINGQRPGAGKVPTVGSSNDAFSAREVSH